MTPPVLRDRDELTQGRVELLFARVPEPLAQHVQNLRLRAPVHEHDETEAVLLLVDLVLVRQLREDGGIAAASLLGWWACTVTARHLDQADPSAIVWDEVIAFWLILWLVTPATFVAQAVAFVLFRIFDAAKPGPVAWADQRFKRRRGAPIGWAQGFGILFDDVVAALCTLVVIAAWRFV